MSYTLVLTTVIGNLTYISAHFYSELTGMERLREYCDDNVEEERDWYKPKAPKNWPKTGKIELKNVSIRYRENLPLVLNGLNLVIEDKQKVAVVGRTGSGKSTLFLSLMRVLEMDHYAAKQGAKILIGGMRIDQIGLHELRKKIAIIPQDPFLLEGTLRFNVDPTDEYDDRDIIQILKRIEFFGTLNKEDFKEFEGSKEKEGDKVELSEMVNMPLINEEGGVSYERLLNFEIKDKGTNLSLGQRQLVCIAKALIRSPKILLMDEATANIDQKTDEIVQRVIKNELDETTVLTIAHRLNTIIGYDKVVVLDAGQLAEEGTPKELLLTEGSQFRDLVKSAGNAFFNQMLKLAS